MDSGNTPYNTSVTIAPSTVPWLEVASAAAIRTTTNIQPKATMCISNGDTQYHLSKSKVMPW